MGTRNSRKLDRESNRVLLKYAEEALNEVYLRAEGTDEEDSVTEAMEAVRNIDWKSIPGPENPL